jgi:Protein of unknown function (DUF1592)/Protein of unknown function (DUF1588)/Protein of unknown function (DUF1595)/Protein of unknown function (DUF1585)/Protein of unknown function (DUF1587)
VNRSSFKGRTPVFLSAMVAAGVLGGACSGSVADRDGGGEGGDGAGAGNGNSGGTAGENPVGGPCPLEVPIRRLTDTQYRNSVAMIFDGKLTASPKFPTGEPGSSVTGFSTEPSVNEVTKLGAEQVLDAAEEVALAVMNKVGELVSCAAVADEACARTFIAKYGKMAFRRPLTAAEETSLLGVYRKGSDTAEKFKVGIGLVTWTLLQSPQFLYLVEAGQSDDNTVFNLSDHEIASRLSFLLWDASPDKALLDAADAGNVHTSTDIRAQAERLLGDARATAALARFGREWSELRVLAGKDRVRGFSDALANAQRGELDAFVRDAFLNGKSIEHLLSSSTTLADRQMATFYGLPTNGMQDGRFDEVTPPDGRGHSGLLTMPAVLAARSHSDEPAYVFRGTFVLEKLLCEEQPIPPANVQAMLPTFPGGATQREKSALIQGVGTCKGCHVRIDPIGHGFEGFDELGKERDKWPDGHAVDTTGEVVSVDDEIDGAFDSPKALGERLGKSARVASCVARQVFRFSYSRHDEDADKCAIDNMLGRYRAAGGSLTEMLLSVVQADTFRTRTIAGGL